MREYRVLPWYEEPPSEAWSAIELDSIELDGVLGALEGGRSEWFDGLAEGIAELDPCDAAELIRARRLTVYRGPIVARACTADCPALWGPSQIVDLRDLVASPPPPRPTPPRPRTWFELQLFDPLGRPVPELALEVFEGTTAIASLVTDADGVGRYECSDARHLCVRPSDAVDTRARFEQRWADGRDDAFVDATPLHRSLDEAIAGIDLVEAQRLVVTILPLLVRVRLVGMHFDTAHCFLLPDAMNGIRRVCEIYDEHPSARLLVVGHTDTEGKASKNDKLSLERADSIGAYLRDDVDAWLSWYDAARPDGKRWGTREDQYMLSALPDDEARYYEGEAHGRLDAATTDALRRFQSDQGLKADGIAGPKTRRALVEQYMAKDGTSLPDGIELVAHGCGESFPAEATADGEKSAMNRRVEIFLFDGPIVPAPPGPISAPGSPEYPAWRIQVTKTIDVSLEGAPVTSAALALWLHDATGQRMPYAPFRLRAATGEIRTGYSDAEGMAVVHEFPWNLVCEARWGTLEDVYQVYPPTEDEDAEIFYLYEELIWLGPEPGATDYVTTMLRNLGYDGDEAAARSAFASEYGADDDAAIEDVHANGRAKP